MAQSTTAIDVFLLSVSLRDCPIFDEEKQINDINVKL